MRSGVVYFILGGFFIYLAIIQSNTAGTLWNTMTIVLLAVAAIDLGMGFTMLRNHLRQKKND